VRIILAAFMRLLETGARTAAWRMPAAPSEGRLWNLKKWLCGFRLQPEGCGLRLTPEQIQRQPQPSA
jgi:hypothetical protein